MLYPSLCRLPMAMVSCENLHPDLVGAPEVTYLRLDPEEECYGDNHLAYVLLIALPSFCLYAAGLPIAATFILWRNREFHRGKKYIFRMGLLYSGYRKERWWWECVVVLRKLCVIFFSSFFYNEKLQLQFTLGMMFAAFVLHHLYAPFDVKRNEKKNEENKENKNRLLDVLERNSILVSTLLLWSASVFIVSTTCESGLCYFLVLATMISNIAFLVSGVWFYARYFCMQHHRFVDKVTTKLRSKSTGMNPLWKPGSRGAAEDKANSSEMGDAEGKKRANPTLKETSKRLRLANTALRTMAMGTENNAPALPEAVSVRAKELELANFFSNRASSNHDDGKRNKSSRASSSNFAKARKAKAKAEAAEKRGFYRRVTDDGRTYFESEDGAESTWVLPKDANVIGGEEAASEDLQKLRVQEADQERPIERSSWSAGLTKMKLKAAGKQVRTTSGVIKKMKRKRRYSQEKTGGGDVYYVPEDGGESVWELPNGATVIEF